MRIKSLGFLCPEIGYINMSTGIPLQCLYDAVGKVVICSDLLLLNGWLSQIKILRWFFDLLVETEIFKVVYELSDLHQLWEVAFLIELLTPCNIFNYKDRDLGKR